MKSIEITAKTVDEAIKMAAEELGLPLEQVKIEIIEESSKGFWGLIGGKQARIKAIPNEDNTSKTIDYLKNIIMKMGIEAKISTEENSEYIKLTISGENMGIIIGRRGETLDALQYLANLVANKKADKRKRIILDAEGYRGRREETLEKLAHRLAERARRTGQRVILEPMSPQERRIIHTTLQNDHYVTTLSEGEDPYRKVVIAPRQEKQ